MKVLLKSGMKKSEKEFEMCMSVENVIIKKLGKLGL